MKRYAIADLIDIYFRFTRRQTHDRLPALHSFPVAALPADRCPDVMSLSPWDLNGQISFDFSLYRPRRPSYVFATQTARQRNESYRHATKHSGGGGSEGGSSGGGGGGGASGDLDRADFIEGIVRKKRKESYRAATGQRQDEDLLELDSVGTGGGSDRKTPPVVTNHVADRNRPNEASYDGDDRASSQTITKTFPSVFTSPTSSSLSSAVRLRYTKNLLVLSFGFVLVFTSFRALQNLQSSVNDDGLLGVVSMSCVHATMVGTCLFAPRIVDRLTARWSLAVGAVFYVGWTAANACPSYVTLVPASIGVGFGQSLAWSAQVTYIRELALQYARASGGGDAGSGVGAVTGDETPERAIYRFNGVFLACFQTTHIWGNMVSSLVLSASAPATSAAAAAADDGGEGVEAAMNRGAFCGVFEACDERFSFSVSGWNISDGESFFIQNLVFRSRRMSFYVLIFRFSAMEGEVFIQFNISVSVASA